MILADEHHQSIWVDPFRRELAALQAEDELGRVSVSDRDHQSLVIECLTVLKPRPHGVYHGRGRLDRVDESGLAPDRIPRHGSHAPPVRRDPLRTAEDVAFLWRLGILRDGTRHQVLSNLARHLVWHPGQEPETAVENLSAWALDPSHQSQTIRDDILYDQRDPSGHRVPGNLVLGKARCEPIEGPPLRVQQDPGSANAPARREPVILPVRA